MLEKGEQEGLEGEDTGKDGRKGPASKEKGTRFPLS